ncbi:MAG: hypothetical protein HY290_29620 [Planctomycetia bacterium]|nr:hypothetical protein [Planctomycetia bacterium]
MAVSNVPRIRLLDGLYGWDFLLRGHHGQELVIQFDWDYRLFAQAFGWSVERVRPELGCPHESTDGTVPCRSCGLTPADFLSDACDYLTESVGRSIPDPGFFTGDDVFGS